MRGVGSTDGVRERVERQRDERRQIERAKMVEEWAWMLATFAFLFGWMVGLVTHRVWA